VTGKFIARFQDGYPLGINAGLRADLCVSGSMSRYPTTSGNTTSIRGTAHNPTPIIAETIQPLLANPKVM